MEIAQEINIDYDKLSDILYISFGIPQKAICIDDGNGNLLRISEDMNILGITILDFKQKCLL